MRKIFEAMAMTDFKLLPTAEDHQQQEGQVSVIWWGFDKLLILPGFGLTAVLKFGKGNPTIDYTIS